MNVKKSKKVSIFFYYIYSLETLFFQGNQFEMITQEEYFYKDGERMSEKMRFTD